MNDIPKSLQAMIADARHAVECWDDEDQPADDEFGIIILARDAPPISLEFIMKVEEMGRVLTSATFENFGDLWSAKEGAIADDQVRRVDVEDALVDSGATLVSLPTRLIQQLGLENTGSRRVTSSTGGGEANMYSAVRLTIQGRSCTMDVMEVPDNVPVLIGQLPLEHLDFVIDMRKHALIGNPAHGGEHVYELY